MFVAHNTMVHSASRFMYRVYAWMAAGLLLTAGVSYGLLSHPQLLMSLLSSPYSLYALMFAQIGLVIYLSARIGTMSYASAAAGFCAYASLVGVTLTPIFLVYTLSSIGTVFAITAGMFGAMAVYGYVTKSDLTQMGSIASMALLGVIIATFVNWFAQSSLLQYVMSLVGVAIFTALTAADVQKIKYLGSRMAYEYAGDEDTSLVDRIALMGALTLYLDFVNLFLHLLRLMGKRRE